jgi:hypothetical protein
MSILLRVNLLTHFESFREFFAKVNPSLVMRDGVETSMPEGKLHFLNKNVSKWGILCLLTRISPVRIDRVGP